MTVSKKGTLVFCDGKPWHTNRLKKTYVGQREIGGRDQRHGARVFVFQAHEQHGIKGIYDGDAPAIKANISRVNMALQAQRTAYLSTLSFEMGCSSSWGKAWRS